METKTTSNTSTANKIISTTDGIKTLKTIFDWEANWPDHWDEAKRHSHSHCLLRIYVDAAANRAAVIASELYSNQPNIGISADFEGLAKAVVKEFCAFLSIPLPQIIWIAHHGYFLEPLSYENIGSRDEFSKIDLFWNETKLRESKGEWTNLYKEEVSNLIGWINLERVEKELVELNKTNLLDWTKIDVEKAEEELRKHYLSVLKQYE